MSQTRQNIRLSKELAGGSMMDAGFYSVYAVRYAMSAEPVDAMAFNRKSNGIEVDSTLNGFLRFPNGGVACVWSSVEGPRQRVFQAIGTNGIISVEDTFGENSPVTVTRGDDQPEVMAMTSPNRFQVQLDEFSECALTGKKPEFPANDALRNMGRDSRNERISHRVWADTERCGT